MIENCTKEMKLEDEDKSSYDEVTKVTVTAKSRFLQVAFLKRTNKSSYGSLMESLENYYIKGNDQYPQNLEGSYNPLIYRVKKPRKHRNLLIHL